MKAKKEGRKGPNKGLAGEKLILALQLLSSSTTFNLTSLRCSTRLISSTPCFLASSDSRALGKAFRRGIYMQRECEVGTKTKPGLATDVGCEEEDLLAGSSPLEVTIDMLRREEEHPQPTRMSWPT